MKHTMKTFHVQRATGVALIAAGAVGLLVGVAGVAAAATPVGLGTAGSFVVLAGAGVTNTGPTTLNGDIGTFPTPTISGPGSLTVTGTVHGGDAVTQGAKSDLVTAYDVAAGQGPPSPVSTDLGGQTLTAGVYSSASSLGLTGALTLDAAGDPDAVFVFQAGSTLTTATSSQVVLIGGAQACNVFWQVGSSATLGTGSAFRGTILALTDITVTTGTTVEGRVLARNGAVTLDTNVITAPACTTPTTPGTTTPGTTTPGTTTPGTTTPGTTPGTTTPGATPGAGADAGAQTAAALAAREAAAAAALSGPQVTAPRGGVATGDGSYIPDGPHLVVLLQACPSTCGHVPTQTGRTD